VERDREMGERAIHARLESIGVGVSRYGLVVVLMLIGLLNSLPRKPLEFSPWLRIVLSCLGCMPCSAFRLSPT
jgi:hypothetical protein